MRSVPFISAKTGVAIKATRSAANFIDFSMGSSLGRAARLRRYCRPQENVVIDNNERQVSCAKENDRKRTRRASMKHRQSVATAAKSRDGRHATSWTEKLGKLSLGELNNHLGYFLRRLQIWVFQDFIQMLEPMKLRPAQYSVLLIIKANPGRSQAAIAQTLGIERARLVRLLHELERRKWISRRASGSDA